MRQSRTAYRPLVAGRHIGEGRVGSEAVEELTINYDRSSTSRDLRVTIVVLMRESVKAKFAAVADPNAGDPFAG